MLYPIAVGPFSGLMLAMIFFSSGFIFFFFPSIRKDDFPLILLFGLILFSALFHVASFRFSTIAYSFLLITTFACFRKLLKTNALDCLRYLEVIRYIIYAYGIVLLVQQVSVLAGVSPLNMPWAYPNPFKLNSLAHEPSYVGATLTLLMYSHLKIWRKMTGGDNKQDFFYNRMLWMSYIYVCLTNGSSWTIFTFFLMLLFLFKKQRMLFIVLGGIGLGLIPLLNLEPIERLVEFIPAVFSGDTEYISSVDLSASARMNPLLYYIQDINLFSSNFWFGYGVDYSRSSLIARLLGTYEYMEQGNATGGMFSFFYDFGFIALVVFFLCLKRYALKCWFSFPFILWLFFFLFNGFNTYLTWMFFILMNATLYFEKGVIDARL